MRESSRADRSTTEQKSTGVASGVGAYVKYTTIGIQFLLSMLVPLGLGFWLDGLLGTSPWLVAAGAMLGAVGAMAWVFYSFLRMEKRERERTKDSG